MWYYHLVLPVPFEKKNEGEKYHKFSVSLSPEVYSMLVGLQNEFNMSRSGVISQLLKNSSLKFTLEEKKQRDLGLEGLLEKQNKIMENVKRLRSEK